MRSFIDVQALVSADDDQLQKMLASHFQIDDADATTYASHLKTLAADAVDYEVPFGGVTDPRLVIIVAYEAVTVKLAGTGSAAIPVTPHPASAAGAVLSDVQRFDQPGFVIWTGDIASIHVSNPSSLDEARIFVVLVGEAD